MRCAALHYATTSTSTKNTTTTTTSPTTTLHYNYTTTPTPLHYATLQLQIQLRYTTSSRRASADRCNHFKKHNSNHLSVHQRVRSAIHALQQPGFSNRFPIFESSTTALCGTTGIILVAASDSDRSAMFSTEVLEEMLRWLEPISEMRALSANLANWPTNCGHQGTPCAGLLKTTAAGLRPAHAVHGTIFSDLCVFFWSFYFRKWQEMVSAACCWWLLPLAALFLGVVQLLGAIMCHCWAVLLSCYWVQGILQSPITFWVFDSSVNANHLQMKHLHSSIFRNMIMTVLHMAFGNRTIVHLDGLQLRGRWCSTFCHGLGLDCVVAEMFFNFFSEIKSNLKVFEDLLIYFNSFDVS